MFDAEGPSSYGIAHRYKKAKVAIGTHGEVTRCIGLDSIR